MRVAVLTSLYPSAVRPREGIFAERRWTKMRERGHSVRVVQPLPWAPPLAVRREWREIASTPGHETRAEIEIERPRYLHLPRRARGNARAFARAGFARIRSAPAVDVVVADYAWPASAAAPLFRAAGVPFVISGRGSDVLQVAGEAGLGDELGQYLRAAGHWIAVSQHLVDAMDRIAGAPGRGVLVPNGVDTSVFHPSDRTAARRALGRAEDEVLVLVVGYWIERKDPMLALAAFEQLQGPLRERARLVLVGRGPLERRLRDEIRARSLNERVQLEPEVEPATLARWYAAADALLLTSKREGRPNVVLEALACGLPVLATEAGGTAELLAGLDGMLAQTREPAALARALERLLARAPERAALHRRVEPLSWDASLQTLERCLETAVGEAGRG